MSRLRPFVLALVGALAGVVLIAAPAAAAKATLSGVVRNSTGDPLPGVSVLLGDSAYASGYIQTVTDANGVYALTAPQGDSVNLEIRVSDSLGQYSAGSPLFTLTANRVEDLTFPERATLAVSVTEGDDGSPSSNAQVSTDFATASMTSSGGLSLSVSGYSECVTAATGSCTLGVFRGGGVDQFQVFATNRDQQNFPGMSTPDPSQSRAFVLAPAPTISGVVRNSDGAPVAGAFVEVLGSLTSPVDTGADGRWSLRAVSGGPYRVRVSTAVTAGGRTLPYQFETAPFQHDATRTIDLTMAAVDTVRIDVRSSNGVEVDHPWVEAIGDLSTKSGSTPDGLAVTSYLNRNGARTFECYPPYDGPCLLPVLAGGSSGQLHVVPPLPGQYFAAAPYVSEQPRNIQLADYATATSAGSRAGAVVGAVDHGDVPALDASPVSLPDGLDPVVGRIDYRVTLPPGTSRALFTVNLPGTGANALFTQSPDGGLVLLLTGGGQSPAFDVVDGSAADADGVVNGSVSGNIIPVAATPLRVTTIELPSAAPQKPYSARLQGSGPGAPMVWSIDPDSPLPAGLSLSPDGTISGTAPALGSYWFRVLMRDSHGWQGPTTREFLLRVEKVAVLTSSLPDAYIGGAYSGQLSFANGSFPTWSVVTGSLPPGLKLGAANGTISGTPTETGTYSFDVLVRANGNTSRLRTLSITVHSMEVATSSLPSVPVWASYSQKLATHGGKPTLVWSLAGGSLPPGVSLSSAGVLSGKPTTVGSYPVTFTVKDALGQVANRSLVIAVTPMTITTSSLPTVKKGGYYSQLLSVSGGKATLAWSLASGALPPGLALSSTGRITGYPKAPGTWTFSVKVADSSVPKNLATRTFSITVL